LFTIPLEPTIAAFSPHVDRMAGKHMKTPPSDYEYNAALKCGRLEKHTPQRRQNLIE